MILLIHMTTGSRVEELSLGNWQEVVGSFVGFEFTEGQASIYLKVDEHARRLTLNELPPEIMLILQTCSLGTRLALLKTDRIDRPLALRLISPPAGMTQEHRS